ncbi:transketolase-like TK C-terminal-containing protein [Mycoplasmoides alvi]|uniref:transketolase-like TK C-terminal-containing protein n=1 Tax=Mycoplasmoides alvi TaxID=78580 RepID=UPI00051BE725|nr:transketolase [Mycoplasmoides alvi]
MLKNNPQLAINNIRMLGIEMVAKAKSGHPGIVLGAAPIMYALFKNHLNVYLKDLHYFNRDRFVLSAGHGSALLYSTMLVAGYPSITIEDIKNFRQLNSKTSGHPEAHILDGVDIGTGPLGQGAAASVGFALAEAHLNQTYDKVIDHYTYCLLGDGCLEEGITHEAIAIAGKYKLNKLIWIYDSNDIQLDGKVSDSTITKFSDEFKANNWNYILVKDGNDWRSIDLAITKAKKSNRPTLIEVKTTIGYGSENAKSFKAHGTPLSLNQVENVRKFLKYPCNDMFTILEQTKKEFKPLLKRGNNHFTKYNKKLEILKNKKPDLYKKLIDSISNKISISKFHLNDQKDKEATRNIFSKVFNLFTKDVHNILVLNNDLSGSTKVKDISSGKFESNKYDQKNIDIGVREFLGAALALGITMHGGLKAITSTFMSFSDYCKPAIRLAAINQVPSINVFSHDSITVGEDGPTHQPIEQLTMLRSMPNTITFRPANTGELFEALKYALKSEKKPVNIVTSRSEFTQSIAPSLTDFEAGFYFVFKQKNAKINLISTGSEVGLCLDIAKELSVEGININVISVTSMELLRNNILEFKNKILSNGCKSIAIEFGSPYMWYEFVDTVYGLTEYGKSGTPEDIAKFYELDINSLIKKIKTNI